MAWRLSRAANPAFAIVSRNSRVFGHAELVLRLHHVIKNAIRQTDTPGVGAQRARGRVRPLVLQTGEGVARQVMVAVVAEGMHAAVGVGDLCQVRACVGQRGGAPVHRLDGGKQAARIAEGGQGAVDGSHADHLAAAVAELQALLAVGAGPTGLLSGTVEDSLLSVGCAVGVGAAGLRQGAVVAGRTGEVAAARAGVDGLLEPSAVKVPQVRSCEEGCSKAVLLSGAVRIRACFPRRSSPTDPPRSRGGLSL